MATITYTIYKAAQVALLAGGTVFVAGNGAVSNPAPSGTLTGTDDTAAYEAIIADYKAAYPTTAQQKANPFMLDYVNIPAGKQVAAPILQYLVLPKWHIIALQENVWHYRQDAANTPDDPNNAAFRPRWLPFVSHEGRSAVNAQEGQSLIFGIGDKTKQGFNGRGQGEHSSPLYGWNTCFKGEGLELVKHSNHSWLYGRTFLHETTNCNVENADLLGLQITEPGKYNRDGFHHNGGGPAGTRCTLKMLRCVANGCSDDAFHLGPCDFRNINDGSNYNYSEYADSGVSNEQPAFMQGEGLTAAAQCNRTMPVSSYRTAGGVWWQGGEVDITITDCGGGGNTAGLRCSNTSAYYTALRVKGLTFTGHKGYLFNFSVEVGPRQNKGRFDVMQLENMRVYDDFNGATIFARADRQVPAASIKICADYVDSSGNVVFNPAPFVRNVYRSAWTGYIADNSGSITRANLPTLAMTGAVRGFNFDNIFTDMPLGGAQAPSISLAGNFQVGNRYAGGVATSLEDSTPSGYDARITRLGGLYRDNLLEVNFTYQSEAKTGGAYSTYVELGYCENFFAAVCQGQFTKDTLTVKTNLGFQGLKILEAVAGNLTNVTIVGDRYGQKGTPYGFDSFTGANGSTPGGQWAVVGNATIQNNALQLVDDAVLVQSFPAGTTQDVANRALLVADLTSTTTNGAWLSLGRNADGSPSTTQVETVVHDNMTTLQGYRTAGPVRATPQAPATNTPHASKKRACYWRAAARNTFVSGAAPALYSIPAGFDDLMPFTQLTWGVKGAYDGANVTTVDNLGCMDTTLTQLVPTPSATGPSTVTRGTPATFGVDGNGQPLSPGLWTVTAGGGTIDLFSGVYTADPNAPNNSSVTVSWAPYTPGPSVSRTFTIANTAPALGTLTARARAVNSSAVVGFVNPATGAQVDGTPVSGQPGFYETTFSLPVGSYASAQAYLKGTSVTLTLPGPFVVH